MGMTIAEQIKAMEDVFKDKEWYPDDLPHVGQNTCLLAIQGAAVKALAEQGVCIHMELEWFYDEESCAGYKVIERKELQRACKEKDIQLNGKTYKQQAREWVDIHFVCETWLVLDGSRRFTGYGPYIERMSNTCDDGYKTYTEAIIAAHKAIDIFEAA